MRLHRQPCFLLPTRAASSLESTCQWMVAQLPDNPRREKTMKVLVTGATGRVGGEVVKALLQRGAGVRALTRKQPKPGTFPSAVEIALGELSDPVSIAEALKSVDKLF